MDFYLNEKGNGYSTLLRDYGNHKDEDHSFFKKNAKGDVTSFVEEFQKYYDKTKGRTYISLLTCNHDTIRAKETLDDEEIKIAYATIFTMPGVPFLYYGDEIGMTYRIQNPDAVDCRKESWIFRGLCGFAVSSGRSFGRCSYC